MQTSFDNDACIASGSAQTSGDIRNTLRKRLASEGLRVVDISCSDSWDQQQAALHGARVLILILTPDTTEAERTVHERQVARFRSDANLLRRMVPVVSSGCEPLGVLQQFAQFQWSERRHGELLSSVVRMVSLPVSQPDKRDTNALAAQTLDVLNIGEPISWGIDISADGQQVLLGVGSSAVLHAQIRGDRFQPATRLEGHSGTVVATRFISGSIAVSGSETGEVMLWDLKRKKLLKRLLEAPGRINDIACARKHGTVVVATGHSPWVISARTGAVMGRLVGHELEVNCCVVFDSLRLALTGSADRQIRVWSLKTMKCERVLTGHSAAVLSLAVDDSGSEAITASADGTIKIWSLATGATLATFEGHTDEVLCVRHFAGSRFILSCSHDCTVKIWNRDTGECVSTTPVHSAFRLASTANRWLWSSNDGLIRLVQLDTTRLHEAPPSAKYANAKVLLMGDSGVGKTGLSIRLTEDRFEPTVSTDAAWATQLRLDADDESSEMAREVWLWDFAGQADYRLIHQLYMDETALAVLVFNPQSDDPFDGLAQWNTAIDRAARRQFRKILVAGRCDRGGLTVSREIVDEFCRQNGYRHYVETSALSGKGCAQLRALIISAIAWDELPWVASPLMFKVLKDAVLAIRDQGHAILRIDELKQRLEMALGSSNLWARNLRRQDAFGALEAERGFTPQELETVLRLLAGPGVLWQLEFGGLVLLQPEVVNQYASAVIRSVRKHVDEIGCIAKRRVLEGDLDFPPDMNRLDRAHEQIVLTAMVETFLSHNLCIQEAGQQGELLVFPSYFKRERPARDTSYSPLVTYTFSGAADDIYATLVVRLHHTSMFEKQQLWRNAVDFQTAGGQTLGVELVKHRDGRSSLSAYFEHGVSTDMKIAFVRYLHDHLEAKALDVARVRHYQCEKCGWEVESQRAVAKKLAAGERRIVCVNCNDWILLRDLLEERFTSTDAHEVSKKLHREAMTSISNQGKELILVGYVFSVAGEAGQIFRPTPNSDWGIDGEIEFTNNDGSATGQRLYLQLKSGDSYVRIRKRDGREFFRIVNARHLDYWQNQAYDVMLVIRNSQGEVRWMNISSELRRLSRYREIYPGDRHATTEVEFVGEALTAHSLYQMRDKVCGSPSPDKLVNP